MFDFSVIKTAISKGIITFTDEQCELGVVFCNVCFLLPIDKKNMTVDEYLSSYSLDERAQHVTTALKDKEEHNDFLIEYYKNWVCCGLGLLE